MVAKFSTRVAAIVALSLAFSGAAWAADTIPHNEPVAATTPFNGCMFFDQGTSGGADTKLCAANAAAWATGFGFGALTTTTPASGITTFLTTPSSANLASALTDKTGSGLAVFGTSPTMSGVTVTGSFTATGLVTNADLANASMTVGGATCTLGSSCSPSGSGTVGAGLTNQIAGYTTSGTTVNGYTAAGDVTATISGSNFNFTLANTGVSGSTCTNCNLTYDSKGRITVAANGSSGGSVAFSGITSGTNTNSLVMGAGGSLTRTGGGTIDASTLGGATFAAPGAIGGTTPGAGTFSSLTSNGNITAASLDTTGTVAGSICRTSGGLFEYKAGVNCYASGSGSLNVVTDGSTTVTNPAQLIFSGATVTNTGGNATVTVAGGGGGGITTVTDGSTTVTSATAEAFGTGFLVSGTTGTATINMTTAVNPQAGSSYTVLATDKNKTVNRTNGSAMTDTLPVVGTSGFGTGFGFSLCTAAGADTLSSSSNINGAGSLSIPPHTCVAIADLDNTTYSAFVPGAGGSGNMTGSGATTTNNILCSNNTGSTLNTAIDCGYSTSTFLAKASNLSDVASAATSRNNLLGAASSGTPTRYLGLDGSNVVVTGTPTGTSLTVTDGSTSVTSTTNTTYGTGFLVSGTTGTATINMTTTVNPQSGSSYTVLATDNNKTINRTNSGAMTDTLPAVGTTGFGSGFGFSICTGAAADTLSSSSNINGAGSLSIPSHTCVAIADLDNATYSAFVPGTGGGSTAFSAVTAGTNTSSLVMGAGGSLTRTGGGTIDASTLGGATFAAPGAIGGGTPSTGAFTTVTQGGVKVPTSSVFSIGWVAGQNPDGATVTAVIPANMTISAIKGRVEAAEGSAGRVNVYATSGATACASGTNLTATTGLDINAQGDQTLSGSTTLTAGQSICVHPTSGTFTTNKATISIYASPT